MVASETLFWGAMDPWEGMRRFESMLPRAGRVPRLLYARAMRDYGGIADIADELGVAEHAYSTARDLFRELDDRDGIATATFRLGVVASARDELEEARRLWEESRVIWRDVGDPLGEIQVLGFLGALEIRSGDVERGLEMSERSLALGRDAGWSMWVAWRLTDVAEGEVGAGRTDAGERRAREALALSLELSMRPVTAFAVAILARVASQRGDLPWAAALWATIEAEHARSPIHRWDRHRARHRSHLPKDLPPAAALTLDEAVELVIGTTRVD
jgi:tetratricopeptide (TPR) repeat protein